MRICCCNHFFDSLKNILKYKTYLAYIEHDPFHECDILRFLFIKQLWCFGVKMLSGSNNPEKYISFHFFVQSYYYNICYYINMSMSINKIEHESIWQKAFTFIDSFELVFWLNIHTYLIKYIGLIWEFLFMLLFTNDW